MILLRIIPWEIFLISNQILSLQKKRILIIEVETITTIWIKTDINTEEEDLSRQGED